jgi:hypothetical protein
MKIRRLSYGLVVTFSLVAVACGDTPPPETPPVAPPPSAMPTDAASAAPAPTDAPSAAPADTSAAVAPPAAPPAKPNKDKFVGKWAQDFSGDVQAAAADAAKKAGGAKADQKKIDAAMKKSQDAFTKTAALLEVADGTATWSMGGKPAHKFKFDVSKDDGASLNIKANEKDEVTKKDMKDEQDFTFTDDNTITIKNPDPKDKKGTVLVFKRQ